jgi:tetratricopeptide (TPR) repeat protein
MTMRLTSTLFLASAIAGASAPASAQNAPLKWADTVRHEIDAAYLSGDVAKIQAARALSERVATAFPNDGLVLHYEAFAIYREATMLSARGTDAAPQFVRAQAIFEKSLKSHPLPETHVLLSSIDGQLIAKDPSRGMELGMASQASISAAQGLGPNNPRVTLVRGQGAIYTPPEYGGGLKIAEELLKQSIAQFDKDAPKPGEPSWGKAEAHAWLGMVYQQMNDKAKAAAEFKTAMEVDPSFTWPKTLIANLK